MKKLMLLLVFVVLAAGGAFGQAWYNSYAPGIEGSKLFINAGIGFGIFPYSASVEYGLSKIPLSIGGYFGTTGYDEKWTMSYTYKGMLMVFGAKASYHFNFLKNLDPYVGLVLGLIPYKQKHIITIVSGTTVSGTTTTTENDRSLFYYGFHLGTRYFFTKNIGAYVELGYSASIVSAGLTVKF